MEREGELILLTKSLEEGRARKQSRATLIENIDDYGARELRAAMHPITDATATVIERSLAAHDAWRVRVPPFFPLALADRLRTKGVELSVAEDPEARRRAKRDDELEAIEATQRVTEEAWQLKALRPGIMGREVHELVEDVIFVAGYDTLRAGQQHKEDLLVITPEGSRNLTCAPRQLVV